MMGDENNREAEGTPVDDVRKVRDRLAREAHGNVRELAERSNQAYEELRKQLGLHVPEPAEKAP
ncbi:MAG TPA: hypothetical protein VH253_01095 [Phycisphaerae bacterium]|nr:hypothetical protein [Phycisphaerae bacterium]